MSIQVIVDGTVVYEEGDRLRKILDKLETLERPQGSTQDFSTNVAKLNDLTLKLIDTVEHIQSQRATVFSHTDQTQEEREAAIKRQHAQGATSTQTPGPPAGPVRG